MNDKLSRYMTMPEVYCALGSKAFLTGELNGMTDRQKFELLEARHKIRDYCRDMESIQNRDIFIN